MNSVQQDICNIITSMFTLYTCYKTLTTQWPWVPSTGLNLKPLFGNRVKTTKSTQNCKHSCCTWEVLVQCGYWECKASRNRATEQHGHCGNRTDSCGKSKNCNHVLWTNYILWNIVLVTMVVNSFLLNQIHW